MRALKSAFETQMVKSYQNNFASLEMEYKFLSGILHPRAQSHLWRSPNTAPGQVLKFWDKLATGSDPRTPTLMEDTR